MNAKSFLLALFFLILLVLPYAYVSRKDISKVGESIDSVLESCFDNSAPLTSKVMFYWTIILGVFFITALLVGFGLGWLSFLIALFVMGILIILCKWVFR